jgi:predicted thioesterase
MALEAGQTNEMEWVVTEEMCADYHGNRGVQVLASPYLIGALEMVAAELIQAELPEGQGSVGVHVDVHHLAATPLGMKVRARAELAEINGKRLRFKVEARDEADIVMSGSHERYVLESIDKFIARVRSKKAVD